jgi:hypothetical protein
LFSVQNPDQLWTILKRTRVLRLFETGRIEEISPVRAREAKK